MKFRIDPQLLSDTLSTVGRSVASKGARPVLANFLVIASGGELRLIATDLEVMTIARIKTEIERDGHFTIPARLLTEAVATIPNDATDKVLFEIMPDQEYMLNLACDRHRFVLQIQAIDDFPAVPTFETEPFPTFEIESKRLEKAFKEVGIAMGNDEQNPSQRSISVNFVEGGEIQLVTTDSKRLALTRMKDVSFPEEFRRVFVIPARAVHEIIKIASDCDKITIGLFHNQLLFVTEHFQMLTRLVDARFPDFSKVIPKHCNHTLKVCRKSFAQALKSMIPIAKHENFMTGFDIGANEVRVWTESTEYGKAEVFVPASLEGDPINVAFNANFVLDFLGVVETDDAVLRLISAGFPGLFKPAEENTDFSYILMPMTS